MKDLEAAIQAAKETDKVNAPITVARQNAYDKLNKYYNLSDKSHTLYAAATKECTISTRIGIQRIRQNSKRLCVKLYDKSGSQNIDTLLSKMRDLSNGLQYSIDISIE
jgi:hypothetical protein